MLQSMRQNTKWILWIVIIAFVGLIFAVWGMDLKRSGSGGPTGSVGEVNGREIDVDSYRNAYQQEVESYRGQTDLPVMESVVKTLEDQAWKRMVNQVIIEQGVHDENIMISDEEIVQNIRTNPPDFIQYNETFQTEGRFDYQKYLQYVNDVNVDWRWLETYFRQQLPVNHLQARVATDARITEGELRNLYRQRSESVDFSFVAFLPNEFSTIPVEVTAAEVRAYYDSHSDEFQAEEVASLEFATVAIEVTDEDRAEIRGRMNEVLEKIELGTSFNDLARFFSQGQTAGQGGDIGSFQKGAITPELEEAAFALEAGEVTGIIEGENDMQILQCVEKTGTGDETSVTLRQILLRIEAGPTTIENVREETERLRSRAQESNLATAAEEEDSQLLGTGPFARGTYVPGVGDLAPANLFAFSAEPGDISDPILHNSRYYIFSLASRDSAHVRSFDEVRAQAELGAQRGKRLELAAAEAAKYASDAGSGSTLDEIARKASRDVETVITISRVSSVPGIGNDMKLVLAAFAAGENVVSGPVSTGMGSFYVRKDKLNAFDEQQYALERASLIRSLVITRQDFFFTNWLDAQREVAEVKDFRTELAERSRQAQENQRQQQARSTGPLGY